MAPVEMAKSVHLPIAGHPLKGPRPFIWDFGFHLMFLISMHTVPFRSIRPSRAAPRGGLDEIGLRSQVTAHLAGVKMWFVN